MYKVMKGSECHGAPWRKYLGCQIKIIKEGKNAEYGKRTWKKSKRRDIIFDNF